MSEIGRQVKYGIGIETVSGTAVAPTRWFNQLSFNLGPKVQTVNNESSWGNLVRTNSSDVVRKWSEGDLEAKLTPNLGGLMLAVAMGSSSTSPNADASGLVYDHTIDVANTITSPTFTLVRQDSLATTAYAGARVDEWTLSMDLDKYVTYKATIMAKDGATTTATAAFSDESEFLAKNFGIKSAASVAGLGAASNESLVEQFSITAKANIEADNGAGSATPESFSSRGYELSFEMTSRYNDTDFETAFKNGTPTAWRITLENADVTIGTAAHPAFVFTAPKVSITDWVRNEDLDKPITQTMKGTIHFSPSDIYALRAVATNTLPSLI